MKTREEALAYALSFPKTYQEAPFHDNNWQLVRVEGSKKAFLWTYEREGYINLNVKADPSGVISGEVPMHLSFRDGIRIKIIGIPLFWMVPFRSRKSSV